MKTRRTRSRLLAPIAVAVLLSAGLLVVPVLPAHAVRVPETLAHNVAVGNGPVFPGFPIEYLGVYWEGEHGDASARFREGGRWGPWTLLEEDGAQTEGQYGTQLVSAGGADAYQVRVPGHAVDARAVAINVHDGDMVTVAHAPSPAASAGAAVDIVSRAGWGADESLRFNNGEEIWPPAYYDVQKLTVHHTATKNDDTDPAGTMRAIYRYHAVDKGWGDIGYQYLIDESGVVYEGRWSGTDGDVAHDGASDLVTAAHVDGSNSGNVSIALLGDFRSVDPKPAAQASLEGVLVDLAGRHGIAPEGSGDFVNPVNGTVNNDMPNISGHKDWEATECPGTRLYERLPAIRSSVAARLDPAPATAPAAPTGLTVTGVTASSVSLTWIDSSSDESGFEVARNATPVTTLATGTTSWTDTALSASTTYAYEVRAVNTAGPSAWAGPVAATTPALGGITLTTTATKVKGLQKADLRWTNATTADVYWNKGSGPPTVLVARAVTSPYRHNIDRKGGGSYTYEVRSGGVVSNRTTVTF